MNSILCIIFTFTSSNLFALVMAGEMGGPADIAIERIVECDNPDDFPVKMPITMKKLNRTHAGFSGCLDLPYEINEDSVLNLTAAKWGDGGWKPNALNFVDENVCKILKNYTEKVWDDIMQSAGREDGSCPIPKDKYCVEDKALILEGLFPNMLYGKFRVDVVILNKEEQLVCIRAFVKSDPPKKAAPSAG